MKSRNWNSTKIVEPRNICPRQVTGTVYDYTGVWVTALLPERVCILKLVICLVENVHPSCLHLKQIITTN